jgi:hypothetical protein
LFEGDIDGLEATDFGSGYVWFISIDPGLELPIDEYTLRNGK